MLLVQHGHIWEATLRSSHVNSLHWAWDQHVKRQRQALQVERAQHAQHTQQAQQAQQTEAEGGMHQGMSSGTLQQQVVEALHRAPDDRGSTRGEGGWGGNTGAGATVGGGGGAGQRPLAPSAHASLLDVGGFPLVLDVALTSGELRGQGRG